MQTVESPNAACASRAADATASASAAASATSRIPRPPPPAEAFTRSGNPIGWAIATSSSGLAPSSTRTPGSTGTPAASIWRFASSFEPIEAITEDGGPTKRSPACSHAAAKWASSDRNPYPGCTASAPDATAAPTSRSARR